MLVKIEEIVEQGLELNEGIPSTLLEQVLSADAGGTGFRARGGFQLKARLSKLGRGVLLEASFVAAVTAPCKRCVDEVALELPVSFTLNLVPEEGPAEPVEGEDDGRSEQAGSFSLGDADEQVFDGKTIDLDPILREQVLLALPISVVCRDECRGLCTVCGQNLNDKECGCERRVLDPRLAALKAIKLN